MIDKDVVDEAGTSFKAWPALSKAPAGIKNPFGSVAGPPPEALVGLEVGIELKVVLAQPCNKSMTKAKKAATLYCLFF